MPRLAEGQKPSTSAHGNPARQSRGSSTSSNLSVELSSPTMKRRESYGSEENPRPNLAILTPSIEDLHQDSLGMENLNGQNDTSHGFHDHHYPPPSSSRLDQLFYAVSHASPIVIISDFVRANAGLLLIICSQFFFALMNVGVKFLTGLSQPVPTFELIATRMAITAVCCVGWMHWQNVPYPVIGPPGVRHLLVLRGVTGFFGLFGMYYSLQYLSLSDATAITFLQPSTISVAGFLLLHEPLKLRELTAGLCALFGVLLIARPAAIFGSGSVSDPAVEKGTPADRVAAVGVALLGVLGATGALITIRHIGTRAHPMHSISYFSVWCVIVAVVGSLVMQKGWVIPTDPMWSLGLFAIGVAGFLGQVFLTKGLQMETASRGSIGLYTQIIYSTVLERIFFNNRPAVLSIIGTCIIMTSAVYIALSKNRQPASKASSTNSEPLLPVTSPTSTRFSTRGSRGGSAYIPLPTDAGRDGVPVFADDEGEEVELPMGPTKSAAPAVVVGADGVEWNPLSPFSPRTPANTSRVK
ncbi:hypothetical protein DL93DRAFT_2086716 [Clavulina sp. PMI_390]|nr:hypothetical protein DL93DRAFT_2086716 [Clavulina sp. PMI_390]